jgi:hypothetical protein
MLQAEECLIALNENGFEDQFHLCKSKTKRNLDRSIPR